MFMIPYEYLFEENARAETRTLTINGYPPVPDGEYALLESYCPDPECDCRRVLFRVLSRQQERIVSTFSCAFPEGNQEFTPEQEPFGPQSPFTFEVIDLVVAHLEDDAAYVERLKTHYQQVKSVANDSQHPFYSRLAAWQEEVEREEYSLQEAVKTEVITWPEKPEKEHYLSTVGYCLLLEMDAKVNVHS